MNILLIKPPSSDRQSIGDELSLGEPLELEYVAAGVADNHDVRILDMRLAGPLADELAGYAPDVVGLTCYTPQVYTTRNLCREVKDFNANILTVVGGHHATMVPEDFCDPAVDVIVRGEGVFTFRELVERCDQKRDIYDVKGISYYRSGKLISTEPRIYPNLDSLPFPIRSLTARHRQDYFLESRQGRLKPLATLRTSKGCSFRCKFCFQWKLTDGKYLTRNPDSILEELRTIAEPYIYFADDETFIDLKRMDRLADLIIDVGIKKTFITFARSDTVIKYPELFKKWREAGLGRVLIGVESNRPKDLEYFRKKNTITNNEQAILLLREMGVKSVLTFIIHPDFDIEDFDHLADYAINLKADFEIFYLLTPLPGTDLYEELKGQLTTNDLELFDLGHMVLPSKLPLEKFYKELAYLYHRTNKVAAGDYDRTYIQKFMRFYKGLRNRYLDHQAR